MTNSRDKGKKGELELVHFLKDFGYDVHRSAQYCGKHGDADLEGISGMHIECKRVEKLNIDEALAQAIGDKRDGEVPVVFHRKNRTEWKVTLRAEDFMEIWTALDHFIRSRDGNL